MERRFYTTSEVARMLSISLRKIISYTERGYIEASVLGPRGHGSRRLWAPWDLKKVELIQRCEEFGLSPRLLRRIAKDLTAERLISWPFLLIDDDGRISNAEDSVEGFLSLSQGSLCLYVSLSHVDDERQEGVETRTLM
jgi:DNA-binding transcriptional MerR regulator